MQRPDTAAAASLPTGHRHLLRGMQSQQGDPPAAAVAAVASSGNSSTQSAADSSTDADLQAEAADAAAAAAASSTGAGAGAVLYRQGGSIILQSSSRCGYQFLVTRNPALLQPEPSKAAGSAGYNALHAQSSRHRRSSSWWVSAGALFAGVSAVLALAICYMSAQLWHRYRVRMPR